MTSENSDNDLRTRSAAKKKAHSELDVRQGNKDEDKYFIDWLDEEVEVKGCAGN